MGFILIMILSLAGGVPVSINKKKEDFNDIEIEMVESRDDDFELKDVDPK